MTSLADVAARGYDLSMLAGLVNQVAQQFVRSLPAAAIRDLAPHVSYCGPLTIPYLQRSAGDALIAAIKEQGQKPFVREALRTLPVQYALWTWYLNGGANSLRAAMPGSSVYENCVAISIDDHESWVKVLMKHNWQWHGPHGGDPSQFIYHGPQDPTFGRTAVWAFQRTWNTHNPDDVLKDDGVLTPQTIAKLEQSPAEGF